MQWISHLSAQGVTSAKAGGKAAGTFSRCHDGVPEIDEHLIGCNEFVAMLTGVTSAAHDDGGIVPSGLRH